MPSKRLIVLALIGSLLWADVAPPPARADVASAVVGGTAKFAAERILKAMVSGVYNTNCKASEHDVTDWICGALGDLSGDKEKQWKENLTAELAAIRKGIDELQRGQVQMQRDLDTLVRQNEVVLAKLDNIVDEEVAQLDVRMIQTLWSQHFESLIADEESFSRDRLLRFARVMATDERLNTRLGTLSHTLTKAGVGKKPPLIEGWTRSALTELDAAKDPRLAPAYEYLESALADLLFEQRKGLLMYVWAAEILESECEIRPSPTCQKPPILAAEFEHVFDRQVSEQLAVFNASIESMVLARSDVHGAQANCLHPDAAEIFRRADFFTAANLGSFGPLGEGGVTGPLFGRVISMGDRFDGKLDLSGSALKPTAEVVLPVAEGTLDWWRATATPLVFDEVHFANSWRIFRYRQPGQAARTYQIKTTLPYKPEAVRAFPVDLLTGKAITKETKEPVVFGSFVAIERAGGGYALLSGTWRSYEDPSPGPVGSTLNRSVASTDPFKVYVESRGKVQWSPTHDHVDFGRSASLISDKMIRYPAGGWLALHAVLWPELPAGEYPSEYAIAKSVLGMSADTRRGGLDPKSARYHAEVRLVFAAGADQMSNGLVWRKDQTFASPGNFHLDRTSDSAQVEFDHAYPLWFQAAVHVFQHTAGTDATSWAILAKARLETAYLTKSGK